MNKDQIKGAIKETGGKVRAAVDHVTGDKSGEAQGKLDQAAGNVQKNYGNAKDALKKASNS